MVALAPKPLPIGEKKIKLSQAPEYVPFCLRKITDAAKAGWLEWWWWGGSRITTVEALHRVAVWGEPTIDQPAPERRRTTNRAKDAVGRFLALK